MSDSLVTLVTQIEQEAERIVAEARDEASGIREQGARAADEAAEKALEAARKQAGEISAEASASTNAEVEKLRAERTEARAAELKRASGQVDAAVERVLSSLKGRE